MHGARQVMAALFMTMFSSAAAVADVSGLYVRQSTTQLEVFHIIEGASDTISGRYELYSIEEDGDVSSDSHEVEGELSADQISLRLGGSIKTLFLATTITGEVRSNALDLIWSGGGGQYQKSTIAERNELLDDLNVAAGEIVWIHTLDANERLLSAVRAAKADLSEPASDVSAWMNTILSRYGVLEQRHHELEAQATALGTSYADNERRYELQEQAFDVDEAFYVLKGEVDRKRADLRYNVNSIARDLDTLTEFCDSAERPTVNLQTCLDLRTEKSEFDSLLVHFDTTFGKWDAVWQ